MTRTRGQHEGLRARLRSVLLYLERIEGRDLPSFITAPSYPAGTSPIAMALADFDGDGIPDQAVANHTANGTVSILKGRGDGSFTGAGIYPGGWFPADIVAADFTGDGVA